MFCRQVRPQYLPGVTFLSGAHRMAMLAPGATGWNWLQNGSAESGPETHTCSVRVDSNTVTAVTMSFTCVPEPLKVKQVSVLPPGPGSHGGDSDANAEPAPAKSAIAQTEAAISAHFRRVSLTEPS